MTSKRPAESLVISGPQNFTKLCTVAPLLEQPLSTLNRNGTIIGQLRLDVTIIFFLFKKNVTLRTILTYSSFTQNLKKSMIYVYNSSKFKTLV